jgi:hypothetical protein
MAIKDGLQVRPNPPLKHFCISELPIPRGIPPRDTEASQTCPRTGQGSGEGSKPRPGWKGSRQVRWHDLRFAGRPYEDATLGLMMN